MSGRRFGEKVTTFTWFGDYIIEIEPVTVNG